MWLKPLDQSLPRIEARFGLSDKNYFDHSMDMNFYHLGPNFKSSSLVSGGDEFDKAHNVIGSWKLGANN